MQRVDDVTGETIRLTAHQKELRVESMIARINELTRQANDTTAMFATLRQSLETNGLYRYDVNSDQFQAPAVTQLQQFQTALKVQHEVFVTRTFRQRLRWLLTGR
jgi:hypothetical protein